MKIVLSPSRTYRGRWKNACVARDAEDGWSRDVRFLSLKTIPEVIQRLRKWLETGK